MPNNFYKDDKFIYQDTDKKVLIKYIGNEEMCEIPEGTEIIGQAAFASCYFLKSLIFPTSLKAIKKLAFFNCINLETNPFEINCEEIADDAFLGCASAKRTTYVLKEMTISEIERSPISTFYVKDYQRGYRWTKNEIEELLCDINETKDHYCLQPLIVQETVLGPHKAILDENGLQYNEEECLPTSAYELVDGQQRLTTLLLILNACNKKSIEAVNPKYKIHYELLRKTDKYYIDRANDVIVKWFKNNSFDSQECKNFANKIREQLFFIWYEMKTDPNLSVETEFRNINDGQTPLTNAELFKAMLLNPENAGIYNDSNGEEIRAKLFEIAYEWDKLEQELHDENFWFFIANSECTERTHLDYLFELYGARIANLKATKITMSEAVLFENEIKVLDRKRERFSFLAIKKFVEHRAKAYKISKFDSICAVWNDIVRQYHQLYSWFKDLELYHNIGYLVATEKVHRDESIVPSVITDIFNSGFGGEMVVTPHLKMSTSTSGYMSFDMPHLKKYIHHRIKTILETQIIDPKNKNDKTVLSDNYYLRNKKDIRDFLLYVNIWSTQKASERFPFCRFKNSKIGGDIISWDIEHVSARNLKMVISKDELTDDLIAWWQKEVRTLGYVAPLEWNTVAWGKFAEKVNKEDPDNSISNLVLLDSNTNRSYGNALFFGKRAEIIDRDKKSNYIPICTKNAFLKYYNPDPDFSSAWTEADKNSYLKEICTCICDGIYQNKGIPPHIEKKIKELGG